MNVINGNPHGTNRKNARWAGVFYVIATVAPIFTFPFIGFLGGGTAGEPIPDYLVTVSVNESQVIIGMLIELAYVLAVVGIISTLYPTLKRHHEALSLGFFGLRFMEAISTMIHGIILLSLLTLSQEYAAAGFPDSPYFQMGAVAPISHGEFVKIALNSLADFSQMEKEFSLPYQFSGENQCW